jgi:HEAT repeat protein
MIAILAIALLATVARSDEPDLKALFGQLFPEMSQEQPQQKWQVACWNAAAPGHEAQRSLACMLMAEKLGPETPTLARLWLLKQLERIGREECVTAIAPLLADKDRLVRDAAVRALANNPSPAACGGLRGALNPDADPALQVALVNALGFRAEPESCDVLAQELQSNRADVACAAARALARLATGPAVDALKGALEASSGQTRRQIGDALARCGLRLASQDNWAAARSIAKIVYRPDEPARLAGLELTLRTAGINTATTMLKVLSLGDKQESDVAVGFVANLGGNQLRALADGLTKLPPAAQVALLGSLGARRDRAALPAVAAAAASTDPAVRSSALAALGGVGDASTVPLLVKAIEGGGELAGVARRSLETVFAAGVDQALIDTLQKSQDPRRMALYIEILDHRRATSAIPALLHELDNNDGNVRRRAIAALGNVAGPRDVLGLIKGLLKIADPAERDEAGRAVAAVCARDADDSRRALPVLNEYRNADSEHKDLLLPVLGRIGGDDSLAVVREALASPDIAHRKTARQALFNWPDSAAAADLARLAETAADNDTKVRAIRELARVAVLPGHLSDDERLALLTRAFSQANRNEEKWVILDRAREIHSFAAVRFAAKQMDDPKLASAAIATVVDLLHRDEIRQPNQAAANSILDQVIALSKDKSLVERAKSFKLTK